jgi:hypothetical protein
MDNRGADPRASQGPQGACTLRLREAQSGPVPFSGARRQNKVLDKVSAAILGGVAAENVSITGWQRSAAQLPVRVYAIVGCSPECSPLFRDSGIQLSLGLFQ